MALLVALLAGCVTTNLDTGEVVPRGDQKHPFSRVERDADKLRNGMSKLDVQLLLGSPAEKDDAGDLWVYLPERYGIVVPARALRLEFEEGRLIDFGYRPIVLGARL